MKTPPFNYPPRQFRSELDQQATQELVQKMTEQCFTKCTGKSGTRLESKVGTGFAARVGTDRPYRPSLVHVWMTTCGVYIHVCLRVYIKARGGPFDADPMFSPLSNPDDPHRSRTASPCAWTGTSRR